MEVLSGRTLLDEKENNVLVGGAWKDGGPLASASKPGRKNLLSKKGLDAPALFAKTPGPAAKTPGRRALGDITNANHGSKAAKTPKVKTEALKTPARKVLGNITNQRKSEQAVAEKAEVEISKGEGARGTRGVRRAANGRRIVAGVNLRLTAEQKVEIQQKAASLAESGIEHVHVSGQQLEEWTSRKEEEDPAGSMRSFLGIGSDYVLIEAASPSHLVHSDDEGRLAPVEISVPSSPDLRGIAYPQPSCKFDDNDLLRASLDVLPSLSDRELEFDWQEVDMEYGSDAD